MMVRPIDSRDRRVLKWIGLVLGAMLAVDLVLMATTFFYEWGWIEDVRWSVAKDRGFGELLMYAQEIVLIVLCLIIWRQTRQAFAWVWALIFLFLFVDDAFQVHERIGGVFAEWSQIETRGMMRGQDYGELAAWSPFLVLCTRYWSCTVISRATVAIEDFCGRSMS